MAIIIIKILSKEKNSESITEEFFIKNTKGGLQTTENGKDAAKFKTVKLAMGECIKFIKSLPYNEPTKYHLIVYSQAQKNCWNEEKPFSRRWNFEYGVRQSKCPSLLE